MTDGESMTIESFRESLKIYDAQLLPCPFCGAPGELRWDERWRWFLPHCSECDADIDDWFTKEDAIAAWNKRVAT